MTPSPIMMTVRPAARSRADEGGLILRQDLGVELVHSTSAATERGGTALSPVIMTTLRDAAGVAAHA